VAGKLDWERSGKEVKGRRSGTQPGYDELPRAGSYADRARSAGAPDKILTKLQHDQEEQNQAGNGRKANKARGGATAKARLIVLLKLIGSGGWPTQPEADKRSLLKNLQLVLAEVKSQLRPGSTDQNVVRADAIIAEHGGAEKHD
jgi:hypothetical protein